MNIRTPTIAKISNLFCGIYQNENKIQEIHYKINSDFTESAVGILSNNPKSFSKPIVDQLLHAFNIMSLKIPEYCGIKHSH